MWSTTLLILGASFLLSTAVLLVVSKRQRDVVLDRLHLRRRRSTTSLTPPRSLSPTTEDLKTSEPPSAPQYQDVFPPCRRSALADLPEDALGAGRLSAKDLSELPHDTTKLLSDTENVLDPRLASYTTPTGFTVEEIQALGDFPDYATLSGVPLPAAYPEFDIAKAIPRPYRPMRWAYHQTMSLTKMEPDWWLELESTYESRIQQRKELFIKHGEAVLQALPGSEIATKELMEMALQFLCARYPHYFRLDKTSMVFHNAILGTETHLKTTPPLHVLLDNVPEDFAIMLRDPETGLYSFRSGVICSSLGWSVGSKIGMKLHEIHEPIPDYKEKMQFSMDRYFAKKPTDKPIQRGSWGLEIHEPLFMPPHDPHAALRTTQDPTHTLADCTLRVDWQTLRRLPLSAAVVFNFKALFTPVAHLRTEPHVPALLLTLLTQGKRELMLYKGTWHTEHVVVPALRLWEREQREGGVVGAEWTPRTLDESPFFPGWEAVWRARQGF